MNWKKQLFEYRRLWPYSQHVRLDEKYESPSWSTTRQKHIWRGFLFIVTNTVLFLAYSLLFVHFFQRFIHESQQEKGLIYYNNIVVQQRDLDKLGKTSVPLRDKSGFLAGIDVIHELHCLNYVREHIYAEYYKFEAKKFQDEHIYHCIDHIREILMCHGDIAVHTYEKSKEDQRPLMKRQTTHECRKWEPLFEWAIANEPSHAHGPILEHPILGIIQSTPINETQA
ncbi:hypothetical protein PT974_00092 [Cladobotryum mycophilum]|uniref:Tat pathway signal sequence protein n=1 Tax=Cladobotryum mycophilum TaxID=491253 RepID=A0ABR0SZX6_9HYPO